MPTLTKEKDANMKGTTTRQSEIGGKHRAPHTDSAHLLFLNTVKQRNHIS